MTKNRMKANRILSQSIDYVESPVFKDRGIEKSLFEAELPPLPDISWYAPTVEDLQSNNTVMTQAQEKMVFLQYNYAKKKLRGYARKRKLIDGDIKEVIEWNRRMLHIREYIIRMNLRLVLAIYRRGRLKVNDFEEAISEGNLAIFRAMEKFSIDRGVKFSSYACRAIIQALSRSYADQSKRAFRYIPYEPDYDRSNVLDTKRSHQESDYLEQLRAILRANSANLSDREMIVIKHRFGLGKYNRMTLEEIGKIVGVTKERIRQVEVMAIDKIRTALHQSMEPNHELCSA